MKKEKQARPNNNGESASNQTKKTPSPLCEVARRFQDALALVDEEMGESLAWAQSDNEQIRILSVRQHLTKLREAASELVKAKGVSHELKTSEEALTAGHDTARNIWLKIGLSTVEMAAVRKLCGWLYSDPNKHSLSEVVRELAVYSLAHWNEIEQGFCCDIRYARAENFTSTEEYREGLIKRTFILRWLGVDHWE